jgi:hypothetical protein
MFEAVDFFRDFRNCSTMNLVHIDFLFFAIELFKSEDSLNRRRGHICGHYLVYFGY